jgi:hypothetical protein
MYKHLSLDGELKIEPGANDIGTFTTVFTVFDHVLGHDYLKD